MRQPSDTSRALRAGYRALIVCTVAVGAVTFTLSFVGLSDYGVRVEKLNPWLAPLVPIGVDILSLCGVAATYLLRHARRRVRAYAWLVFGVAVALSVAGNLTHAVARHLSTAGMVGAAAWPILLALAAHLVIVTRRALERGDSATRRTPDVVPAPASDVAVAPVDRVPGQTADGPVAATPTASPTATATHPSQRQTSRQKPASRVAPKPNGRDNDIARQAARRRVADGESCAVVARDINVSTKTVERWTSDIRQPRQTPATPPAEGDSDDPKERTA